MMEKQTLKEWRAEAAQRFGKDPSKWAFVCPACGHVATVGDFLELGADASLAYQECIGRVSSPVRPPDDPDQGCNWAAYGLFGTLGKGRIVAAGEKDVEVFDFAPATRQE